MPSKPVPRNKTGYTSTPSLLKVSWIKRFIRTNNIRSDQERLPGFVEADETLIGGVKKDAPRGTWTGFHLLHQVNPFTVGADPSRTVAHSPFILRKAARTDFKAARTTPTERRFFFTAMTSIAFPASATAYSALIIGAHRLVLLCFSLDDCLVRLYR
jgi:hypothetical protein